MNLKKEIEGLVLNCVNEAGKEKQQVFTSKDITINITPAEYTGDYTIVLFAFIKKLGTTPEALAQLIASQLSTTTWFSGFNMVKGFMNIEVNPAWYSQALLQVDKQPHWGLAPKNSKGESIVFEYPSPNTNKPLHLGHLRNIFLGSSLANIMEALGYTVHRVCLYNDRGTNISKSMWAYRHAADKKSPEKDGIKGDHLVGDYYVSYADHYKAEIKQLMETGLTEEEAKKQSTLDKEINRLTVLWEQGDKDTRDLWTLMNGWFYQGVKQTYATLDLTFDKEYFESEVYNKGRETVKEGLEKGVFTQKEDSSVWIDLTDTGLDEKLVLRSNGTTVYITQDIALAYQKQTDFTFNRSIYVVGNEQDYHFKVLFEILRRLGLKASDHLHHLSYGMVELPTGKMKSREGTVVDADDLLEEVVTIAREKADEQGKLSEVTDTEKENIYRQIGLGALRYYILKVDPVKKMIYNPAESIDFNGNTAPFIQYIHARTCSLQRNAVAQNIATATPEDAIKMYTPNQTETRLMRTLLEFPLIVEEAGNNYSPALVANYVYQVAASFSTFYHDYKVIKEEDIYARTYRLLLSAQVGKTIKNALELLGIHAPERM